MLPAINNHISVRFATQADVHVVSAILTEAAAWLDERGIPLWNVRDVSVEQIREDVTSGLFILAEANGQAAGTLKYQMEDPVFWPDVRDGDSAFVHKVAVARPFAGGMVSAALLKLSVDHTKALGRRYVRLDCDASRLKLRQVYERFGFQYHSDKRVGPYHVARYEYHVAVVGAAQPELT